MNDPENSPTVLRLKKGAPSSPFVKNIAPKRSSLSPSLIAKKIINAVKGKIKEKKTSPSMSSLNQRNKENIPPGSNQYSVPNLVGRKDAIQRRSPLTPITFKERKIRLLRGISPIPLQSYNQNDSSFPDVRQEFVQSVWTEAPDLFSPDGNSVSEIPKKNTDEIYHDPEVQQSPIHVISDESPSYNVYSSIKRDLSEFMYNLDKKMLEKQKEYEEIRKQDSLQISVLCEQIGSVIAQHSKDKKEINMLRHQVSLLMKDQHEMNRLAIISSDSNTNDDKRRVKSPEDL